MLKQAGTKRYRKDINHGFSRSFTE